MDCRTWKRIYYFKWIYIIIGKEMRKKINFIRLIVYLFRFITIFVMKIPFNVIRVNYLRIFSKIGKYLNLKNIVKTQCPNNKIFK